MLFTLEIETVALKNTLLAVSGVTTTLSVEKTVAFGVVVLTVSVDDVVSVSVWFTIMELKVCVTLTEMLANRVADGVENVVSLTETLGVKLKNSVEDGATRICVWLILELAVTFERILVKGGCAKVVLKDTLGSAELGNSLDDGTTSI